MIPTRFSTTVRENKEKDDSRKDIEANIRETLKKIYTKLRTSFTPLGEEKEQHIRETLYQTNAKLGTTSIPVSEDEEQQEFMVMGSLPTKTDGAFDNNGRVRSINPNAPSVFVGREPITINSCCSSSSLTGMEVVPNLAFVWYSVSLMCCSFSSPKGVKDVLNLVYIFFNVSLIFASMSFLESSFSLFSLTVVENLVGIIAIYCIS
jgi:hypothetical protein